VIAFFVLTFGLAWGLWFAAELTVSNPALAPLTYIVRLLGVFAPGIVALGLSARQNGRAGAMDLLSKIARFDVKAGYYVFAVGLLFAVKLAAALILKLSTGAWPQFGETPIVLMFGAILISAWTQAGEELGWRAYALPRMAASLGLGPAAIILGVIWATWHLPMFYLKIGDLNGQSFPLYMTQVVALSVILAWLYWRTRGSLFLVMVMHAAVNNTTGIVPSAVVGGAEVMTFSGSAVGWTTAGILWAISLWFLYDMRLIRADLIGRTTHRPVPVS
jgi:membrane protease YdiL (CAAX protease family)